MGSEDVAGRGATPSPAREDAQQTTGITAETLAAIDRASDLDRAWFARHPNRAYRLRPVVPGEFGSGSFPVGAQRLALVKQMLPGSRMRLPFWAVRRPCSCDTCLSEIWDAHVPEQIKRSCIDMAASLMAARP